MRYPIRAVFMGEVIEDVYHYGRLLARPLKEPIICIEHESSEHFRGGIAAAAAHAETFCKEVMVLSDRTMRKHRYVEREHKRKLFQVYERPVVMNLPMPAHSYDLCAVIDYGHGMMTEKVIDYARSIAPFYAVNVQTNSGNHGFNLATKYERLDYLCVDEQEARLATQNQDGALEDTVNDLSMIARIVVVTRGRHGAVGYTKASGYRSSPALTEQVVDTMGAGDAFFALSALAAASGETLDEIMRVGNAAGAAKSQILGHQRAITQADIK